MGADSPRVSYHPSSWSTHPRDTVSEAKLGDRKSREPLPRLLRTHSLSPVLPKAARLSGEGGSGKAGPKPPPWTPQPWTPGSSQSSLKQLSGGTMTATAGDTCGGCGLTTSHRAGVSAERMLGPRKPGCIFPKAPSQQEAGQEVEHKADWLRRLCSGHRAASRGPQTRGGRARAQDPESGALP